MITAVVGHRGTGKSELMKRLNSHLRDQDVELMDLDEEIDHAKW
jgi:ABC-type phosphate/phosphonate transport system ATPase subunit